MIRTTRCKAARRLSGRWFGRKLLALALCASAALGGSGCASSPRTGALPPGDLAWPRTDPRVRFEAVVEPAVGRRGPGRWLRALVGVGPGLALDRPYGVAWDQGDLLVTDPGAGRVLRLSPRGRVRAVHQGFASPIAVRSCSRGIVVTDSEAGSVTLLDRDLEPLETLAEGLARPTGLCCAGDRIYVAETGAHRVRVLAPGGRQRRLGRRGSAPGEFNFPTALEIAAGALWVGDTLNFRVQRLDPESGAALGAFGRLGDAPGEMPRLKDLAMDAAGNLWVSDAHLDRVSLYRPDGTLLLALGGGGSAPGEFSFPAGIATHPDGRIAVVDSFNRRVQLFRLAASDG